MSFFTRNFSRVAGTAFILGFVACGPTEVKTSVTVDVPVERAWQEFNDPAKLDQWLIGFQGMELIEGEEDTVGSKYRLKIEEDGEAFELIETITVLDPPNALGFNVFHESMTTDLRFDFTAEGEGTRIDMTNRSEGNSFFWKIMVGMMSSVIKERHDEEFAAFKKMVEGR